MPEQKMSGSFPQQERIKKIYRLRFPIALFITIIAVLIFYSLMPEQEQKKDDISLFLQEVEQETKVSFSDIKDCEFGWNKEEGETIKPFSVHGKSIKAEPISTEEERRVTKFFEDQSFSVDIFNVAAGTVAYLTGYEREGLICVVHGKILEEESGELPGASRRSIEIKCGKIEG